MVDQNEIQTFFKIFTERPKLKRAISKYKRGLGIRVNSDGTASVTAIYSIKGKPIRFTYGDPSVIPPEKVEQLHKRAQHMARNGVDPRPFIAPELNDVWGGERRHSPTLKELSDYYMENYAKVHNRAAFKKQGYLKNYILPAFGNRKIHEIKRVEIQKWHVGMKHTPYAANRALEVFRHILRMAAAWGFVDEKAYVNQATDIRPFPTFAKERVLWEHELEKLLVEIDKLECPYQRASLLTCLITGFRADNVRTLRWNYIDFEARVIKLPRTKNGKPLVQPLPLFLERLLRALPSYRRRRNNPWIFPSSLKPGYPISRLDKALYRCVAAAGLAGTGINLHVLRKTAGSYVLNDTGDLKLTADILGHSCTAVTAKHYAMVSINKKRDALENHADFIQQLLSKNKQLPSGVLKLKRNLEPRTIANVTAKKKGRKVGGGSALASSSDSSPSPVVDD